MSDTGTPSIRPWPITTVIYLMSGLALATAGFGVFFLIRIGFTPFVVAAALITVLGVLVSRGLAGGRQGSWIVGLALGVMWTVVGLSLLSGGSVGSGLGVVLLGVAQFVLLLLPESRAWIARHR